MAIVTSARRPTALFAILVAVLAILFVLVVYGWPLFVRPSLSTLPGGYSVTARDLGGPIWSPRLRGAVVRGPGLKGEANDLRLRVRAWTSCGARCGSRA
jgi:hypothetical protein